MKYGSSFAHTESGVRINEVRGGPREMVYVIALVLNLLCMNAAYRMSRFLIPPHVRVVVEFCLIFGSSYIQMSVPNPAIVTKCCCDFSQFLLEIISLLARPLPFTSSALDCPPD